MRLLLDAHLSARRIGEPLSERGHDVRAVAAEAELDGLADEAVLRLAADDRRILVTRNSRDFAPICRRWAESQRLHSGVILIWSLRHNQFAEIVDGVERRLEQIESEEAWHGLVVSV
jgi:predicted nuclease of predicted toxin-antitoxin system